MKIVAWCIDSDGITTKKIPTAIKKEILITYTWVVSNKDDTSPTLVYTILHQDCNKEPLKSCMQPWEGEYLHSRKKIK